LLPDYEVAGPFDDESQRIASVTPSAKIFSRPSLIVISSNEISDERRHFAENRFDFAEYDLSSKNRTFAVSGGFSFNLKEVPWYEMA